MRSAVHIVFLLNSLGSGGAEKQSLYLARDLSRIGWRCSIAVIEDRAFGADRVDLLHEAERAGVRIVKNRWSSVGGSAFAVLTAVANLARHRRSIVWAWGGRAEYCAKLCHALLRKHVIVSSLRSASVDAVERRRRVYRWRQSAVSAYISNSQKNIDVFREVILPASAVSFHWLANSVASPPDTWVARAAPFLASNPLRVAVLGNNRYYIKGYDVLLDVAKRVQLDGWPVVFSVAGIDYDGNLRSEIESRQLRDVIEYVGPTGRPFEHLAACDAYLLSSRVEGMPNSLMEALSLGMPAISTDVGGVSEVYSAREHLLLCAAGNPQVILDHVLWMLNNWQDAVDMGERARLYTNRRLSCNSVAREADAILRGIAMQAGLLPC